MLNKSVARRYAEAFFSTAKESGKINEFQDELGKIVQTIEEVPDLKEYFAHPLSPVKGKKEIAVQIFSSAVSPLALNFLLLVLDKKRQDYLGMIYSEYVDMADESRNITKAELISAMPISDDDLSTLSDNLSRSSGKTVQLKVSVDPSIIGGLKIRLGDKVIDASIAKKLEMLKRSLQTAKIS